MNKDMDKYLSQFTWLNEEGDELHELICEAIGEYVEGDLTQSAKVLDVLAQKAKELKKTITATHGLS